MEYAPAVRGFQGQFRSVLYDARVVVTDIFTDDSIILRKLALEKLTQGLYAVLPSELQSAVVKAVIIAMPDLPSVSSISQILFILLTII
jgi:hypothetical protein